jgi:hypothetical protein
MAQDPIPRIFVNIAAYRDRECQWTVRDLFAKATHPDRIFVGICWQFIAEEDADCFLVETRPEQCRVIRVDARNSLGACWARHKAQSLWQDEDFTLQIDSHMRFVEHWDEKALAMLAACPSGRPVLSSYPAAYTPPDTIDSHLISTIHVECFDPQGIPKQASVGHPPLPAGSPPVPSPFCSAGFLFADSRINVEVPYDPQIYFHGEETALAVRLWTHGWDIFSPSDVLAYHNYNVGPSRPRHWQDQDRWNVLNNRALARLRHLLGIEPTDDPSALADLDRYGLGSVRSLADYERFSGIEFHRQRIDGKTREEIEAASPPDTKRRRNREMFTQIWRDNFWQAEETRSGPGSTLAATSALRPRLLDVFERLSIRSLADAGCGDLNWMALISTRLDLYLGLDIVDGLLSDLRARHGRKRGHFFADLDVMLDDLPPCDAILCRDVLTHFPDYGVHQALARFVASGSRYLIATTHPRGTNDRIDLGGWQAIDLCAAPYLLPAPDLVVEEGLSGSNKSLGVWKIADLEGRF